MSMAFVYLFETSLPVSSQNLASNEYQEIYTAVKDKTPLIDLALSYRSGVSNPFNYSHGIDFTLRGYFEGRFYGQIGYTHSLSGFNDFSGEARADLIDSGFGSTVARLTQRYSLGGGLVFLDGVLNFLGSRVVPFDVSLGFLVGQAYYDPTETRFTFGPQIDFRGLFSKNFGITLSATPILENSSTYGILLNSDVSLGIFLRFF